MSKPTKVMKHLLPCALLISLGLGLSACKKEAEPEVPATAYTTVQGALAPGVYGRIDIGNAPPPPLIYAQPIIIQRAPQRARQEPLYLHVPPGHAKKWSKHCAKYNACNRPVYFVRVSGDDDERRGQGGRQDAYRDYEEQRGGRSQNDDGGKHG